MRVETLGNHKYKADLKRCMDAAQRRGMRFAVGIGHESIHLYRVRRLLIECMLATLDEHDCHEDTQILAAVGAAIILVPGTWKTKLTRDWHASQYVADQLARGITQVNNPSKGDWGFIPQLWQTARKRHVDGRPVQ